jgi:hypothetical protein
MTASVCHITFLIMSCNTSCLYLLFSLLSVYSCSCHLSAVILSMTCFICHFLSVFSSNPSHLSLPFFLPFLLSFSIFPLQTDSVCHPSSCSFLYHFPEIFRAFSFFISFIGSFLLSFIHFLFSLNLISWSISVICISFEYLYSYKTIILPLLCVISNLNLLKEFR